MGAGSQPMADARANAGMVGQGYGLGMQGYGQAGNLYGQEFQGRMAGYNAQMQAIGGLGQGIGTFAGLKYGKGADGGQVPHDLSYADGGIHTGAGEVSGPGGPVDDKVPALLSNGEYVIPADVVKAKGVEFFDKLKAKYHTPAAEQRMGIRRN
jgi:hypothetical protein